MTGTTQPTSMSESIYRQVPSDLNKTRKKSSEKVAVPAVRTNSEDQNMSINVSSGKTRKDQIP